MNGSTALHIAVERGHIDIVRLLLHDYEVFRHLRNNQNQTAYELAQTDEMRQLFRRSTSNGNRFCDATISSPQLTLIGTDADENQASDRVKTYEDFISIRKHHAEKIYPYHDNLFRRFFSKIISCEPINDKEIIEYTKILSTVVDESVCTADSQYRKAKSLVENFSKTGKPEPLLRLFTLATSFYTYINQNEQSSDWLALPIYNALHSLHSRAFTGQTYRGLTMTLEEMKVYRSTAKVPKLFLVTNTFCSTTRDRKCAEAFAEAREHGQRKKVVMIFDFPRRCLTAIRLNKISDQLPCISEIEDEQEVLKLPRTPFYVNSIEQESPITTIHLEYCYLDQEVSQFYTMWAYEVSAYD